MLVLGLDPGSRHTGYGVVEERGDDLVAIDYGRISLPASTPLPTRLRELQQGIEVLLSKWSPEAVALEALFHGINSRSLIVLAQTRGALLAASASAGVDICEYSPSEIKVSVTGNGRADKTQVARMVGLLLALDADRLTPDTADALACAICLTRRYRMDRLAARVTRG